MVFNLNFKQIGTVYSALIHDYALQLLVQSQINRISLCSRNISWPTTGAGKLYDS